ncbi:hypothetical protein [Streptomyces xylophagus]|uniref:hypothetical protein n=1 Tax=Streptomyces xylophagus TaxID=285514 RepID=UPI00068F175E|nr:hypothetical protein [Streptomyces xylophagus]
MQPYEEEFGRRYREEEEEEFGAERHREERVAESLESPFSEEEEVQLATELLGVTSEEELEQFLGNWLRAAAKKAGGFLRSPVGQQLGGILKNVAKQALPAIGGAIGTAIGGPGLGTVVGSKAGSWASNLFEVEGEGVDHEEYEFETARRFVALSGAAARNAAFGSRRAAPRALAQQAVHSAARRYAPGVARRFRAFAVPAPWYWPAPVPAFVEEPAATAAPAPDAPAAKEEWGESREFAEWPSGEERYEERHREEGRHEEGRHEERHREEGRREEGRREEWGHREEQREFGEERGWGRSEEEETEEEEEWGRAEEEKRAREEGWGHAEGAHHNGHHEGHHNSHLNGHARSGRWVRQGRKIVIMGA